jgi:hypothetical protein
MGYTPDTIAATIKRLNVNYLLPAIQREFVWEPAQVVKLFDSVMRGYPIGSFLFWEVEDANRDKWDVYKFLDRVREGGTHNQLANTAGIKGLTMVLDGQQRLTSLNIGLRGVYEFKKKYGRKDNPDTWSARRLFLDLFKNPKDGEEGDAEEGVYYGFKWIESSPVNGSDHCWFSVGRVLDFESESRLDDFKDELEEGLPGSVTKQQIRTMRNNLDRPYRAIHKDEIVAYYSEREQDYDRVLDIFVRANSEGTKLTKSDLLLSMVTSNWAGLNAREEIYGFLDRLNTQLTRRNKFSKDFVLKSSLALLDLPVTYKVENFSSANLDRIRHGWDSIKASIEGGVDFINSRGIDGSNLTSANALIPMFYFLHRQPSVRLRGTSETDYTNASLIRRWLCASLLNNVFGGSSDSILSAIRETMRVELTSSNEFPAAAILETLRKAGRPATFDDDSVDRILDFTYGGQRTFLALTLLYDEAAWGTMAFHQDHIFPKSRFSQRELSNSSQEDWFIWKDRLGNLCLLLDAENEEKSNKSFEEWVATRSVDFRQRHLIPDDSGLYRFENFDRFLQAREELIRDRLKKVVKL